MRCMVHWIRWFYQKVFNGFTVVSSQMLHKFQWCSLKAQNQMALIAWSIGPRLQVPFPCLGVYHRSLFAGELWREDEVVLTASTNEVGDDVLYGRCEVIQPGRAKPGTVHNCRKRHWFLDTAVIVLTHSAARPAHLLQQLVANVGLWYPRILFLATKYLYNPSKIPSNTPNMSNITRYS